jgi:hypothetical protein
MKSLNAKRIAAIVTGAALLGAGLAFAGPLTFQNVPIISNSGQPVVQVVIGSGAKPSDGVAAGNIAAAIGNLAYTSTSVTAWVNPSSVNSLKVSVSNAKYSLTNQQVWLNESGVTSSTGSSYLFGALIGSVLNQGVQLGSPQFTKSLQASATYAFIESNSLTTTASPYYTSGGGGVPTGATTPQNTISGGGVSFSTFTTGSYDNLLQVQAAQFSSLVSNWGANGETESLFLTGFPVYDQATSGAITTQFALLSAGGAYQVSFNKAIQNTTTSNTYQINVPIHLLGQNFSIINETGTAQTVTSSTQLSGGKLQLASSVAPLTTVYVGHNLTSGPWTVQLQDLAQTTNGVGAPAAVAVYYNGQQTNESTLTAGRTTKFNVSGHLLFVNVNSTFAGLYAYQKWAKIQLYSGVYSLQNGRQFNATNDKGWYVNLFWTNTSGSGKGNALKSIVIYNYTPTALTAGQSFTFIQNPAAFKVTFLGDTLGNNYDAVTASLSTGSYTYQNAGNAGPGTSLNITEPSETLTVISGINNAFQYGGISSKQISYLLTPYQLVYTANSNVGTLATNVVLSYTAPGAANFISTTYPLTVQVKGYTSAANAANGINTTVSSVSFTSPTSPGNVMTLNTGLYQVTGITLANSKAPPIDGASYFTVTVANGPITTAVNVLSTLSETAPVELLGQQNGYNKTYAATNNALYNQQNGQQTSVYLTPNVLAVGNLHEFYGFKIGEQPVPSNSSALDYLGFGIFNTTGSQGQQQVLNMNYSVTGAHYNATYTSNTVASQSSTFPVQIGFRTEKGSKVASISPTSDTFDMATSVDQLQFALTTTASNSVVSKSTSSYGPYTVGQATNLPNVSIGAVSASVVLNANTSSYSIIGEANLTATPSVTSAVTPVLLTNLSTTAPLVVLDSSANSGSNLILIGSGYVNSLSQQLESTYNVQISSASSPVVVQAYGGNRILVAGYTANQTWSAANSFIGQLYTAAATST